MAHTPTHANGFTTIPNFSDGQFSTQNLFPVPPAPYSTEYQGNLNTSLSPESGSFSLLPDLSKSGGGNGKSFDLFGQGGANVAAGIQGLGSLGNALAAYKQYQLGKDTLAQNKAAFNLNSANQAKITNAQIEDRARRRAAQRSDITGDLSAIEEATANTLAARRVDATPI